MEIGNFLLAWAPVPLILAMGGYLLAATGSRQFQLSARVVYWLLLAMVGVAFVNLASLFIGDKFQFSYVATYSSRDLSNSWPHFFKLSSLWAGQQGTFMLWLVYGLLLGIWVKSKAKENEGWVMFFYILAQTFLLILAIISKPFARLDFLPVDGQGLNPLLQNYWMQIHPPILFLGFASACIPFAFAMAALATNKYDNWVRQTMPWAVFSVVTLGFGIFLGGYWAYETLGWGGYWAWDPVENASVIPWMTGIALVHGMVVERTRGSWRRMNLFLAITLFLLIIYGTFLTRSGVLADFSVHSFVDLGYNNALWASIVVMALISYGLFAYRSRRIKGATPSNDLLSQEFTTFLAVALLLPFIVLVLFWTSFPLVTTILSKIPLLNKIASQPAAIDTSYYNMAGLIFATIFAVILGFNALLFWRKTEPQLVARRLLVPLIIAVVGAMAFYVFGFSKIVEFWSYPNPPTVSFKIVAVSLLYLLFFFAALFALVANFIYIARHRSGNFRAMGGYVAHVGFSVMLIGIMLSSSFGHRTKVTIPAGESRSALGYDVKFVGTERAGEKEELTNFEVRKGNDVFAAHSVTKEMRSGKNMQFARTPHIKKFLLSDLYLSLENISDAGQINMQPFQLGIGGGTQLGGKQFVFTGFDSDKNKELIAKFQPQTFDLGKGESFKLGDRKVTFERFEMGQHEQGMASKIGAVLQVETNGRDTTITPAYEPLAGGDHRSHPVDMPGGGVIALSAIRADIGSVGLSYSATKESPAVEVGIHLMVISGNDTSNVTPTYDPSITHGENSVATFKDGSQLFLVDVDAGNDSAAFVYIPSQEPMLATIELSTKPMINLVWLGFLTIVVGAVMAVFRRMKESKLRE
jgi:cytochrome c-type biogenesis protein CcmF